jgi:hypothetical protein
LRARPARGDGWRMAEGAHPGDTRPFLGVRSETPEPRQDGQFVGLGVPSTTQPIPVREGRPPIRSACPGWWNGPEIRLAGARGRSPAHPVRGAEASRDGLLQAIKASPRWSTSRLTSSSESVLWIGCACPDRKGGPSPHSLRDRPLAHRRSCGAERLLVGRGAASGAGLLGLTRAWLAAGPVASSPPLAADRNGHVRVILWPLVPIVAGPAERCGRATRHARGRRLAIHPLLGPAPCRRRRAEDELMADMPLTRAGQPTGPSGDLWVELVDLIRQGGPPGWRSPPVLSRGATCCAGSSGRRTSTTGPRRIPHRGQAIRNGAREPGG